MPSRELVQRVIPTVMVVFGLAGLIGCGSTARYVTKDQHEGVVAIPVASAKNMEQAEELMAAHFPGGYEVVREEEAVVGQVTRRNSQVNRSVKQSSGIGMIFDLAKNSAADDREGPGAGPMFLTGFGAPRYETDTDETVTTQDRTEWRIHYRRAGSAGMVPNGVVPASSTAPAPMKANPSTNSPTDLLEGL